MNKQKTKSSLVVQNGYFVANGGEAVSQRPLYKIEILYN